MRTEQAHNGDEAGRGNPRGRRPRGGVAALLPPRPASVRAAERIARRLGYPVRASSLKGMRTRADGGYVHDGEGRKMNDRTKAPGRAEERISHVAGRPPLPVLEEIGGHHFPTGHLREVETRLYALDDAIRALYLAVAEAGAQIDALASRLNDPRA